MYTSRLPASTRPIRVTRDRLELRFGLRWTASVPLDAVRSVGAPDDAARRGRDRLKAVLLGRPDRRIELSRPVEAVGLYGIVRGVTTIDLQLDDPERLDALLDPEKQAVRD